MSQGRCAGLTCGKTGELKAIRWHVLHCPDWAELYRTDPGRALSPEEEYDRWLREERDTERAARRETVVADTDARRQEMASRFRSRDPLED